MVDELLNYMDMKNFMRFSRVVAVVCLVAAVVIADRETVSVMDGFVGGLLVVAGVAMMIGAQLNKRLADGLMDDERCDDCPCDGCYDHCDCGGER